MWTQFMDMYSGGGTKLKPYDFIYIEAPQAEAEVIFYKRFGRNPHRVTCTCCGEDYSVSESATLEEASAYERNCEYAYFRPDGSECDEEESWQRGKGTRAGYSSRYVERQRKQNIEIRQQCHTPDSEKWGLYIPLSEYLKEPDVLFITAEQIKPAERRGELPEQGYVWKA